MNRLVPDRNESSVRFDFPGCFLLSSTVARSIGSLRAAEFWTLPILCTEHPEKVCTYLVAWSFFLLLLNCSAWPSLGPAYQKIHTFSGCPVRGWNIDNSSAIYGNLCVIPPSPPPHSVNNFGLQLTHSTCLPGVTSNVAKDWGHRKCTSTSIRHQQNSNMESVLLATPIPSQ